MLPIKVTFKHMKPNFYNKGQQHGTYFKTRRSKFRFKDDIVSVKMDTVVTFNPKDLLI
jgi:hypothetical protein